jgi:hypothetical protein
MRHLVGCDLVLVMDGYDRREVVREAAVLQRLNPGAAYLARVRRLGEWAAEAAPPPRDRRLLVRAPAHARPRAGSLGGEGAWGGGGDGSL